MTIPSGFFQATLHITITGDSDPYNVVTLHAYSLTEVDEVEHCNAVMAGYAGQWSTQLRSVATLQKVVGRFGQDGGDPLIFESDLAPIPGSNSDPGLPQNCALLISKRTSLGGRRGRGRMYLPAVINEALVDNVGNIAAGAVPAFQTRADAMLDNWATGSVGAQPPVPLYLEHFPSSIGSPVPAPTPVNRLLVDPVIATQRRRLRR